MQILNQSSSNDKKEDLMSWTFDQWQQLHQKSEVLFELYRQELFAQMIANAPTHQKERLKGLLFTMQGEKRRSHSLESEQARYYAMMMDSLTQLNDRLSELYHGPEQQKAEEKPSAKILEFKTANK